MAETRKLAAIVVSDVVGYSRLAGRDEELTLARLRTLRSDLIDPIIAVHHGRVVKRTGDGAIVEFRSVVDAVRCAIETQNGIIERNIGVPPERRIEFRIGIHLGDVMEESDGDLMGDGVNIAARLQSICEPNGICLSEQAYWQVKSRLDLAVTDLGDKELKNIVDPVRVYSLTVGVPAQAKPATPATAPKRTPSKLLIPVVSGLAALLVIAAVAGWYFLARPGANLAAKASAHLSIVVLPFQNLSGDPKQDYFADGITDNLTTDLSRIRNSFVIARNTAFTYKGKAVDAKEIGKELGVRYVLEGSVARDGNRVRVNAQLIDAESGSHLWADRFEEDLADLFKLQDDVVARLANALRVELTNAESRRPGSQNPDAIDLAMRGWALTWQQPTPENVAEARRYFESALRIDPNNPDALVGAAYADVRELAQGRAKPGTDYNARVVIPLDRAIALNPQNGMAYYTKGLFLALQKQPDEAQSMAMAGLLRNPNLAPLYFVLGQAQGLLGNYEKAKLYYEQAIHLSPRDPQIGIWEMGLGAAEVGLDQYAAAIDTERKALSDGFVNYLPYATLAGAYALAGRDKDAQAALAEAKRLNPSFSSVSWLRSNIASVNQVLIGLRLAGLPEDAPPPPPKHLSIVVLPFENLSGDPKQDYFADGITDNLTTDLSRIRNSFVIARNTAFTYKGRNVDAKEIGKDLGVRYVLEGSVARDGNRVRVNAQLIDAESGSHLWADRFEEDLADLFKLQDDVVARLANALGYELTKAEAAKSAHSKNPDAIDLTMRGWALLWQQPPTKDSFVTARSWLDQALKTDPNDADALAGEAFAYQAEYVFWTNPETDYDSKVIGFADRAIALDPNSLWAYVAKSYYLFTSHRPNEALNVANAGLAINPNFAPLYMARRGSELSLGSFEHAISDVHQAMKLSPRDPQIGLWDMQLGAAELEQMQLDACIEEELKSINAGFRTFIPYSHLAAAYALAGKIDEAKAAVSEARRLNPNFTVKWQIAHGPNEPVLITGLRKAGLPEDDGPRLSIVVLPFQNLSGDAKQDYLADVLTDELTTYISRIPGSFVIARNTAFTYKGKPTDAKEIGKDLGVRYMLEGSVQPTEKRIRTNAQLIDTETGAHLWAEEFDTDKTDLLQTEDEIVTRLARTLQIQLVDIEAAKLRHANPDNPDAQDLALQCEAMLQHTPAGKEAAADYGSCERALALDPNNVLALQLTAQKLWARLNYGQSTDRVADFKAADDLIARGLAIDPNNARLYWVKSSILALERRFEEASAAAAHSVALDPSDIDAYWNECLIEYLLGQPDEVATCIDQALRLSPHDIRLSVLIAFKGNAHFMKQEYDRSIEWYDRSFALNPNDPLNNIYRIGALSLAGRDADARTALSRYLATAGARSPKTIAAIRKREISDNPRYLAVYDHLFAGLRKAGMPEQ